MKLPVVNQTGATQVTDQTYEVTGVLTPDTTGTYLPIGPYNNKPSYELAGNGWFIWWEPPDRWRISDQLGGSIVGWWERVDPNIEGDYQPILGVTGVATVTEI